jgi:hypothetical protein
VTGQHKGGCGVEKIQMMKVDLNRIAATVSRRLNCLIAVSRSHRHLTQNLRILQLLKYKRATDKGYHDVYQLRTKKRKVIVKFQSVIVNFQNITNCSG